LKILENNLKGIYHATSEGYCNWYQLAEYLFSKLELDVKLKEAKSNEFTKNYKKPHFSVLENDRLKQKNMNIMLHWKEAVDKYLEKREGNN
jgi:dTDP-4-dehydrorhamnose reductase